MVRRGRWGDRTRSALHALILAAVLAGMPLPALAAVHAGTRHKPGPVFLRGVASGVSASHFTLRTKSHGTYTVQVSRDTSITEKGKQGRQVVRDGEHVGVHGFVTGRNIRAIYIHIYPSRARPKGYSVTGTVQATGQGYFLLSTGGGVLRIRLGAGVSVRVGNAPGTIRDVRSGERVRVHVVPSNGALSATSVHIYQQKVTGPSVQVSGTLVAVSRSSITVREGSHSYQIALAGTVVYLGASRVTAAALRPGQTVRVYACCQGRPLVARSIHIRKTSTRHTSLVVRGTVRAVSARSISLMVSGQTTTISLSPGTVFELGSSRIAWSGVRVGDQVSVRAYRSGAALIATRVHVYASSRQSHTLIGVVTGVSGARLTIQVRGRRYTVVLSRGTALTIAGRPGSPSGVRVGDHIRAVGHLTGSTLAATRVSVTRPAAKTVVVHGTVSAIGSGDFWLTDSRGAHYHVRPGPGVQPTLHGSRAPADALFVGVRVTAHGPVVNGVLLASSIAISVTVQTVAGRVAAVRGTRVSLARSPATTIGIDVPPGMRISDGARRDPLSALHQGTYLHVRGYAETGGRIRASSISILHPALDITGTILAVTPDLVMQTAAGERYTLALSASTPVAVQHSQIDVSKADIAVGDHVHIQGTARSDGAVAVQQISVRLASVTLRGAIASLSNEALSLTVSGATEQVRLQSKTTVTQGSHSLAFGDLVAGDDLTVYGYRSGQGWVIARKLEVHRKLVGLDGFVSAIEPQGFALTLTGGSVVHVRTDATTQESGGVVVVGLNVHVTGYRRGDGVVLATRVKVGKPHQQLADFLTDPSVVEQGAHGLEALHQAPSIVLG